MADWLYYSIRPYFHSRREAHYTILVKVWFRLDKTKREWPPKSANNHWCCSLKRSVNFLNWPLQSTFLLSWIFWTFFNTFMRLKYSWELDWNWDKFRKSSFGIYGNLNVWKFFLPFFTIFYQFWPLSKSPIFFTIFDCWVFFKLCWNF